MRRGQTSLEYLLTYGWAFVALLVVIGALAYFGLLSPTRYLPAQCSFGSQLQCVDYELVQQEPGVHNGIVRMQFRNNFGEDINITNIVTTGGPQGTVEWYDQSSSSWKALPAAGRVLQRGNLSSLFQYTISTTDDQLLVPGDRATARLIVTFRRTDPAGPDHNVTGALFATAKEATTLS